MRSMCVQQRATPGLQDRANELRVLACEQQGTSSRPQGMLGFVWAGTLKPCEQPRIISRRRSFNQHDFDDPHDNGEHLLPGLCEPMLSRIPTTSF